MFGWGKAKAAPSIGSSEEYRKAEHVVAASEGDRTVLLDPVNGEYFGLDEVGSRIWQLLPSHRSPNSLAECLADEYDAPRETLAADAARLLAELAAAKLVVPA